MAAVGTSGPWASRVHLASAGWSTETRLSRGSGAGRWSFQAWVSRRDWHGFRSDDITFRGGADLILGDRRANVAALRSVILGAVALAETAWRDFPRSVPCQLPDGSLVENTSGTAFAFGPGRRREVPTESIPRRAFSEDEAVAGDALLSVALDLAEMDHWHEDRLAPDGSRMPGDVADRIWHFRHDVRMFHWCGARVAHCFRPGFPTEPLGSRALEAASSAAARLVLLREQYGPGGPLPPGMLTPEQKEVSEELALRARLAGQYGAAAGEADVVAMLVDWCHRWQASQALRAALPEPSHEDALAALAEAGIRLAAAERRRP